MIEEWTDADGDHSTESPELSRSYTLGLDLIAQFDTTNAGHVLLADAHGSTRGLTNSGGVLIESYDYDAFGNAIGFEASGALTTYLYSGEQLDVHTGFQYLRARYYDPANGRFTRMDQFGGDIYSPLSLHRYGYAHGNPISGIDPTGRSLIEALQSVAIRAKLYTIEVSAKVGPAFAAGGAILGRFFNRIGAQAQAFASNVLDLFKFSEILENQSIGRNVIDFVIRNGNRFANLEVKYSIPSRAGSALTRLANQIQSMVSNVSASSSSLQGQAVVWSLKQPNLADLIRVQSAVGPEIFNKVQFVYGVEGLFSWVRLYFGF